MLYTTQVVWDCYVDENNGVKMDKTCTCGDKTHNILVKKSLTYLLTYLLRGTTVLVELWPPHVFYARFRDSKFLQGGVVSSTPNPQPGGKIPFKKLQFKKKQGDGRVIFKCILAKYVSDECVKLTEMFSESCKLVCFDSRGVEPSGCTASTLINN
jgi:hypothetical protein